MVILLEKSFTGSKLLTLFLFGINIPNQNRKPVSKVLLFRPTYQQTLQFWTKKSKYSFVFWCFGDNFVQIVIFIAFRVQTMAPLWLAHNFSWLYYPSTGIKANFSVDVFRIKWLFSLHQLIKKVICEKIDLRGKKGEKR